MSDPYRSPQGNCIALDGPKDRDDDLVDIDHEARQVSTGQLYSLIQLLILGVKELRDIREEQGQTNAYLSRMIDEQK